jgi:hypothetical protein
MRIDELPKSDRIEDRRGGLSGIPGGRGGSIPAAAISARCIENARSEAEQC